MKVSILYFNMSCEMKNKKGKSYTEMNNGTRKKEQNNKKKWF